MCPVLLVGGGGLVNHTQGRNLPENARALLCEQAICNTMQWPMRP